MTTPETIYRAVEAGDTYRVLETVTDDRKAAQIAADNIPSRHFANLIAETLARATIYPPGRFEHVPEPLRALALRALSDRDLSALITASDRVLFSDNPDEAAHYETIGGMHWWVTSKFVEGDLSFLLSEADRAGRLGTVRFYLDGAVGVTRTEIFEYRPIGQTTDEEVNPEPV